MHFHKCPNLHPNRLDSNPYRPNSHLALQKHEVNLGGKDQDLDFTYLSSHPANPLVGFEEKFTSSPFAVSIRFEVNPGLNADLILDTKALYLYIKMSQTKCLDSLGPGSVSRNVSICIQEH